MCFSAAASFTASGMLVVTGIVSTVFAIRSNPRFIPINLLSFFFAIQQFSEGMIWIGSPWFSPSIWGAIFLFFAFFVYPWFFGYSSYLLTRNPKRKKIILALVFAGVIFGACLYSTAVFVTGYYADARCCAHIYYYFPLVQQVTLNILAPIYVLLTSVPLFYCDHRGTSALAWLIIFTASICWVIYMKYFISVWCFYAAIITCGITVMTCAQWYRIVKKFKQGL